MSDLKAEVEAIEYEHWMLLETGRVLRERWGRGLALVEANAYVESHAIHLRNLIEFLFIRSASSKLMQADDAVFGATWNEAMPDGMGALYGRASEEIAHLSRGRIRQPKTNWEGELATKVEEHFQRWMASASTEVRQLFVAAQARHPAVQARHPAAPLQLAADVPANATNAVIGVNTLSTQKIIGG